LPHKHHREDKYPACGASICGRIEQQRDPAGSSAYLPVQIDPEMAELFIAGRLGNSVEWRTHYHVS
jgi:hypothetical protein